MNPRAKPYYVRTSVSSELTTSVVSFPTASEASSNPMVGERVVQGVPILTRGSSNGFQSIINAHCTGLSIFYLWFRLSARRSTSQNKIDDPIKRWLLCESLYVVYLPF